MSNLKIMKEKQKCHLWPMQILKVFWCQRVIKKNPDETYTKKLSKTCWVQFWL